ncbi:hypothetical protein ACSTLM_01275, partial [Vibrio parahaemolyticus]
GSSLHITQLSRPQTHQDTQAEKGRRRIDAACGTRQRQQYQEWQAGGDREAPGGADSAIDACRKPGAVQSGSG